MKRMISPSLSDLLEHRLEAIFEFPSIFGAGDERAQIQRDDAPVFEALRHVATHDAVCETLDDRGLPHAGFTDEDWVVLGPP